MCFVENMGARNETQLATLHTDNDFAIFLSKLFRFFYFNKQQKYKRKKPYES